MALTTKRIIALTTQTDPQEGDYLAIDNLQGGTHKIPVGRVGVEVDDTLTEAGKAADAKAVGDALDEIRSQVEVTGTASGAIATFTDGAEMPAKSLIVNIEPQQSGTGTPSPDNVRPISGWESVNANVNGQTITKNLGRTVYGGTLDVVTGVLTDKRVLIDMSTLNWTLISLDRWKAILPSGAKYPTAITEATTAISSTLEAVSLTTLNSSTSVIGIAFYNTSDGIFARNGSTTEPPTGQLCYELATPQTYTLTGQEISTLLGENNVWADSGDAEVVYVRDLNITINNLLNNNGTRSLGMMAMSAPTDEQTEEPAEDDMR